MESTCTKKVQTKEDLHDVVNKASKVGDAICIAAVSTSLVGAWKTIVPNVPGNVTKAFAAIGIYLVHAHTARWAYSVLDEVREDMHRYIESLPNDTEENASETGNVIDISSESKKEEETNDGEG